jgi:hypothetical protein
MSCEDFERKLAEYQEGTLSPEEKSLVEAHLGTCGKCSSVLADLEKAVDLLKDLPEVEPPPWFTQKIMAQVREESERKGGLRKKLFYPFHVKIPIEAFATLLVVVIGVYIFRATAPEIRTVARTPQAEIQETAPSQAPHREPTRAPKDTLGKNRGDLLTPPVREKAYAPISPAEKRAITEEQQRPAAPSPAATGMAVEKKQEGIGEKPRLLQEPALPPAPPAREKEALGTAGSVQKNEDGFNKLRAPQPSKSTLAGKQAVATLSVRVTNVQAAAQTIERILAKLSAQSVTRESRYGNEYINAQLEAEKTIELLQQLTTVGIVKQKDVASEPKDGSTLFQIEITGGN